MLNKAIAIANQAHAGQVDKGGEAYILHPLRVMLSLKTEEERVCGLLHDVVEDSEITFEYLEKEGFSQTVIGALKCLTKKNGESYDAFINRVLDNSLACRVKLADLADNMDLTRISVPTDKDRERIKKYQAATRQINNRLKNQTVI
ncbi:GTP pyrophosphokinase [Eubacteriaceae bacterium ES3]|nr:GTP pyrophosphokinase [Eubacteriaceae bacterium ES3]